MNDHAGGGLPADGSPRESADRRRAPLPTRVDALPPLPSGYGLALEAGLAAIPVILTPDARAAIDAHARLLLAWNPAINLTSITDPERLATLHVVDSLSAVPLILGRSEGGHLRLVDIGSGGGYPGLALAAALPSIDATLVDSVAKKARFLGAAAAAAGLEDRATILAERAEAVASRVRAGEIQPFDIATARAIGSLADLVEVAFPLLAVGGALLAWKRGDIAVELGEARRAIAALGGGSATVHEVALPGLVGHRLVVATKAGTTPGTYPRDPSRRRRSRW